MPEAMSRQHALQSIKVGDLIHGKSEHGGSLICLVTSVDANVIRARTITHQLVFGFDARTGIGREDEYSIEGKIDSVATLPPDILDILMQYDKTNRAGRDPALSEEEIRAFLFVADFYKSNLI